MNIIQINHNIINAKASCLGHHMSTGTITRLNIKYHKISSQLMCVEGVIKFRLRGIFKAG